MTDFIQNDGSCSRAYFWRILLLVLGIVIAVNSAAAQDDDVVRIDTELVSFEVTVTDKHGKLAGTGFFIDPAGTLYTAFSVGADADDFTVDFDGKQFPARQVLADRRSGLAILKIDAATPALPIGKSEDVEVATPVLTVGFPLDLPQTPSFGMIAGFDRKFLGRYFSTTHLRVNLPTQRGEAGAPLLNFKGEVVGILVSSVDSGSACY